jgi:CRP-like cAMP-binding protein
VSPPNQGSSTLEMLRKIALLNMFSESDLGHLLEVGKEIHVEPHVNIVIQGELSWGVYLILEGVVGVFKANKMTGVSFDISQLREGASFGELSLIDDGPRTATVKALVDTRLFFISKEQFTEFLQKSGELKMTFYLSCLKTLIGMLRELDENYIISQSQLWRQMLGNRTPGEER